MNSRTEQESKEKANIYKNTSRAHTTTTITKTS